MDIQMSSIQICSELVACSCTQIYNHVFLCYQYKRLVKVIATDFFKLSFMIVRLAIRYLYRLFTALSQNYNLKAR